MSAPGAAGRGSLTLTPAAHAGRRSLTLPLPPTLAGLRCLGGEVEHQYALQRDRGLARLAARTAEAAQPVGLLAAGCFGDAKVDAEKRATELVL